MQRGGIVKSVARLIRRRACSPRVARLAPRPLNGAGGTFWPQSVAANMVTTSPYLEAPRRLRAFVRAHETSLVVLAALVGTVGGLVVAAMSARVQALHVVLFTLQTGERLSSQLKIEPPRSLLLNLHSTSYGVHRACELDQRPVAGILTTRPLCSAMAESHNTRKSDMRRMKVAI